MAMSISNKAKQQRDGEIFSGVNRHKHPGFPRIGAIATLKRMTTESVEQEVNMAIRDVQFMANEYEGVKGSTLQTSANEIVKADKESTVGMTAYFNSSDMRSGVKAINKVIRQKMELAMIRGSDEGVYRTANHIRNMTRDFKSNYLPSRRVEGDLYDTIADSLEAFDMQAGRQRNQIVNIKVGSYNYYDSNDNPTGVKGSRMDYGDTSLVELTERGTGRLSRTTSPKAGTKRIKRLLKGRNIAGVKRR